MILLLTVCVNTLLSISFLTVTVNHKYLQKNMFMILLIEQMGTEESMETAVSVIIPVYNCEKTVGRCINSVLNQTLADIEVIAVNDGSDDSTLKVLKGINDDRLKIISHLNYGQGYARNNGMSVANGKYIAFVDADDTIEECMLEKCMKKPKRKMRIWCSVIYMTYIPTEQEKFSLNHWTRQLSLRIRASMPINIFQRAITVMKFVTNLYEEAFLRKTT